MSRSMEILWPAFRACEGTLSEMALFSAPFSKAGAFSVENPCLLAWAWGEREEEGGGFLCFSGASFSLVVVDVSFVKEAVENAKQLILQRIDLRPYARAFSWENCPQDGSR
jgi:hypothetical protein